MKKLFILSLLIPMISLAKKVPEAVYGEDNRRYTEEVNSKIVQKLSESVAAIIYKDYVKFNGAKATITGQTLEESKYLCKEERFAADFATAKCSGFLVGPDLFLTAGHCIKNLSYCENYYIVFDFTHSQISSIEEESVELDKDNFFQCSEIIHREYDMKTGDDYALVRLKKSPKRTPLKFRNKEKIEEGTPLFTIGHPSGLAQVYTEGRVIKNNHPFWFSTNLDTFSGNSGGPVFNAETYEVEGVLVRGEQDYIMNDDRDCDSVRKCEDDGSDCMGEEVVRVTNIEELVPGMKPQMPPEPEPTEDPVDTDNDDDWDDTDWDDFFNEAVY